MSNKRKQPNKKTQKQRRDARKARRGFTLEFKIKVCKRIAAGTPVSALGEELSIKRTVLYRWRDAYRAGGAAGLHRPMGRPPKTPGQRQAEGEAAKDEKIAQLERAVGQQQMEISFFRRAFKHLEELRHGNTRTGGTASTGRSGI